MRFRKIFLDITTEEWNRVINTNLNSIYFFLQRSKVAIWLSREAEELSISLYCGDTRSAWNLPHTAPPRRSNYSYKCLALEWAEYNINVNAIAPGFCETSYAENFKKKTDLYNFTLERTPQGKWGASLDVANACQFLASDAAKYITGEVLKTVDGGWSAW